ncbi:MAG TPA: TrbG/VirB9 family P-type conjugative transfer protein [Sphingomonas sp.]|nr:TrbG/VirB9 family P-type conjugative transfer protein [Sphingomonas sp.]
MILRFALTAALLAGAASAPSFARDPRISTRLYSPDEVVRLDGHAAVQATIAFADEEHIENVAIGDSNSWQVTPNKRANLLFVKPLGARSRTNLTVVTDRHTYLFDLVAGNVAAPLYVLRFTYPPEPKRAPQLAGTLTSEEARLATDPPKDVRPVPELNYAWRARGSARISPARVYDDGNATFIAWSATSPIPAILTRNEKGEEGAVNYSVRGDVIVVDSVPKLIILRSGKEMATLENQGKPRASAPSSGAAPEQVPAQTALASAPTSPAGH